MRLCELRNPIEVYDGMNVDTMPKLIFEGRIPMNVAQLMQRRLDVRNFNDEVKSIWMDNYFDTGDAIIYHPDGRMKIVLDSQTLWEMTPGTPRSTGALILTPDQYDALQGKEFKKGKLGKMNEMSREDIKAHPIWKVLARDQRLLNDYTDYVFAESEERFGYDTVMGIYPGSCGGNKPEMRAWHIGRLVDRSYAGGTRGLGSDDGRLLGIAPEVLSVSGKGVSNIKAYTMADLQEVDKAIKGLEGTLHPDVLKPFINLRKKL